MDNSMTPKKLKQLAAACRKAGIKTFKCGDIEFTLTDEIPLTPKQAKAQKQNHIGPEIDKIPGDSLTDEEKLFWSVTDIPGEKEENPKAN